MSDPSQNKADADERCRAAQALELRTSGMPYAVISAKLGYADESGPRHAVDRLLSRVECEGAAELRQIEGARLDAMQSAVWPRALSGDLDAIRTVLSIMGRRAKLFGLDAPTHVALGGISDVEFANEAARLIESSNSHDSVNDFLRALPGSASRSVLTEPISPQTVPIDADWSNIDGPDPETTNTGTGTDDDIDADEFADVPDDILDTAESASLAIIENYRRQRSEAVAP